MIELWLPEVEQLPELNWFQKEGISLELKLRPRSQEPRGIHIPRNLQLKFLAYAGTMQENCLRLMGKKLLVSLAMEGKFANYGLQALDDDVLTAMARELVTQKGVGERADAL